MEDGLVRDELIERYIIAVEELEQEIANGEQEDDGPVQVALAVNGLVIAGELISYPKYCEENELADGPVEYGSPEEPRHYIHLRNAKYKFGSSDLPSNDGMYWRGKVADISGFSVVAFEKGESKPHVIKINGQTIEIQ